MKKYRLINNRGAHQYELQLENGSAMVEYIKTKNGEMVLTHTEVPARYQKQGVGTELVEQVLEDIKKSHLQVVPICPFIADYISAHPQWKSLVVKGIDV